MVLTYSFACHYYYMKFPLIKMMPREKIQNKKNYEQSWTFYDFQKLLDWFFFLLLLFVCLAYFIRVSLWLGLGILLNP